MPSKNPGTWYELRCSECNRIIPWFGGKDDDRPLHRCGETVMPFDLERITTHPGKLILPERPGRGVR